MEKKQKFKEEPKKPKMIDRDSLVKHTTLANELGGIENSEATRLLEELNDIKNYKQTFEKNKELIIKILSTIINNQDKLANTRDKKEKIKELTETLQRLQAEFENYKKRVDKEKEGFLKYAKTDLINKLLPVLDSFELALKNHRDKEKFLKGVELIYAQFYSLLQSEGLKPIKAEGKKFDPYMHEVLMSEETDNEGIVLEELQKGYMLNDKVLRHSKVKVSKKACKEKKEEKKTGKEEKKKVEEKPEKKEEEGKKQEALVPSESEADKSNAID